MTTPITGRVLAIALRPARAEAMREVDEARAIADGGLEGDHGKSAKRGITLLSSSQWADAVADMGIDLPWHTRRANVLIDVPSLGELVGKTIRIGEVEVLVNGITYPCAHIEWMQPGMLKALSGDRGGVYGKILNDGMIRVGDVVEHRPERAVPTPAT
jgi:MOSC domain-containing protein YiiM